MLLDISGAGFAEEVLVVGVMGVWAGNGWLMLLVVVIDGDGDMVGLIVAQGQDSSHHPQGHWIIERGTALDGDLGAWNQTHLAHPEAKFAANFHGNNNSGLIFFHLSQVYFRHIYFRYFLMGKV